MTGGQPSAARPMLAGVAVPSPHAYSDPPLMDLYYGDLRVADRITLAEATKYGIALDFTYFSSAAPAGASAQTEYGQGRTESHRQYVNSCVHSGMVTLVRADNTEAVFQQSGSNYVPVGAGNITSLGFDGTSFHEYTGDGYRLDYTPQVTTGNPVVHRLVASNDPQGVATSFTYGTGAMEGLLVGIELGNASRVTMTYLPGPAGYPVSLLSSVEDFGGRLWTFAYDNGGACTTVQFPSGCMREYAYSPGPVVSLMNSVTTEQGYTSSYGAYTSATPAGVSSGTGSWTFTFTSGVIGQPPQTAIQYPTNARLTYTFGGAGYPVTIAHPEGYIETLTNDPNGLVLQRQTPAGTTFSATYDRYSLVYQSDDALGNRTTYLRDNVLNLTTMVDAGGNTWTQVFDSNRNLITTIDPLLRRNSMTYDGFGQLLSRQDGRGLTTSFGYDGFGNLTTQVNSDGGVVTSVFDNLGRRIASTDPLNRTTSYGFDVSDNVVSVMNALGEQTFYIYNSCLLQATVTPLGERTTNTYGRFNNLLTRQDAMGAVWTMAYDLAGYQISTTDPLGGTQVTSYNAAHQVVANINQLGQATSYFYDSAARLSWTQNARGYCTTNVYNARDLIATQNALGQLNTTTFDALGRAVSFTNALNLTNQTIYDAAGQRVESVDSGLFRTSFSFDSAGNQTSTQDGNGHFATVVYAANSNRVTATMDANGFLTSYVLDLAGQTVGVINPRNFTTTSVYDAAGRNIATQNALGWRFTSTFDADGRQTASTDPFGFTTTTVFDANGRTVATQNHLGFTWTSVYDPLGRTVAQVDPLNHRTTTAFDMASNVVSVMNPLGYVTSFLADANGNRIQIQDASGNLSSVVYDALDRVSARVDALNFRNTQTYNAAGQPLAMLNPLGNAVTMFYNGRGLSSGISNELGYLRTITYDGAGNKQTEVSFGSQTTTNVFDPANRLLARQYMGGTVASWYYDQTSNVTMSVAPATQYATTFAYDALDRVIGRTDPGGLAVSMHYDMGGRRIQLLNPDGGFMQYGWTSLNQLSVVVRPGGYRTSFAYDGANRLTGALHNSNMRYTYVYDAASQILNVDTAAGATQFGRTSYAYDPVGNRTSMQTLAGANSVFSYDAKNRLTEDSTTGTNAHDYTYTYDSVDNRLSSSESGSYVEYSYDIASGLTTSVNASGTTTFGYSMEGTISLVQEPGGNRYTFTQDVEYKLASQAGPTGTRNWYYDASGRMQYYSGPSPAGTVSMVWDGDDYLQIRNAATITNYFTGNGMIHAEQAGGFNNDYIPDALGSVVGAVDQNLNITFSASYKPYGDPLATSGTLPNFGFVGCAGYNQSAGMTYAENYVRARILSTKLGRWNSIDPIWPRQRAYAYSQNNPLTVIDPFGMSPLTCDQVLFCLKPSPIKPNAQMTNACLCPNSILASPYLMLCILYQETGGTFDPVNIQGGDNGGGMGQLNGEAFNDMTNQYHCNPKNLKPHGETMSNWCDYATLAYNFLACQKHNSVKAYGGGGYTQTQINRINACGACFNNPSATCSSCLGILGLGGEYG